MLRASVLVAAISAILTGLLLLGEDARLPEYSVLKQQHAVMAEGGYDLQVMDSPRLTGAPLKFFAFVLRTPVLGRIVSKVLHAENQMLEIRRVASSIPDMPLYYPYFDPPKTTANSEAPIDLAAFSSKNVNAKTSNTKGFKHWSISDYTSRYASGALSPVQVAKAFLAAVRESEQGEQPLRVFVETFDEEIMEAARASAARYAEGKPLGVLDGVPVAVKDELEIKGHQTSFGTGFIGELNGKADKDSVPIARLRAAGAIIVGRTNMHEIGVGVTGYNMAHGIARNPYNPLHHSGGSSSGSAVAVSSGLVPLAVGLDGGGSIRIPAALCGVVGLKPTFLRVPPLADDCPSVTNIGPIAGNVRDAAIGYAVMSGGDESFPPSLSQPAVDLHSFDQSNSLKGLKIGYYSSYTNHSSPEVAKAVQDSLKKLESLGAELVETKLDHLLAIHLSHSITITSEMAQNLDKYYSRFEQTSPEVQILIGFARQYSALDFLSAQRVRAYAVRQLQEKVYSKVDVFVTPSSAITAPKIPLDASATGELELTRVSHIMRFSVYGNFAGTPGIAVPIGYDEQGLPISLQVQSNHWQEDVMLRFARAAEMLYEDKQRQPQVYYSLLDEAAKQSP
ncbi:hypothetical protein Poli38472_000999 [Pythium oligandrum]|uniref:Amidase domain-containing protein n=1 Tax=Pythium oligandrum TaxID=41045 RepID=A0A8K1CEY2_PYTOL|nr:hypothetical protein Poli38472_000999 [Pythium oligandrum]|eukprot:TMW60957.1 hypothetical protein Poli38472_000999 [Pythium oligandrum]